MKGGMGKKQRKAALTALQQLADDDEKVDDDGNPTPLGTGTLDLIARAQYAKSTPNLGYLAAVLSCKPAASIIASNAAGSLTAMSASILRLMAIFDFIKPF